MKYGGAKTRAASRKYREKYKKKLLLQSIRKGTTLKKRKIPKSTSPVRATAKTKTKTKTKIKMLVKKYKNGQTLCGLHGESRSTQTKKFKIKKITRWVRKLIISARIS